MTTSQSGQSFFKRWWWVIAGVVIACAVVVLFAPAASSDPDGLDRVSGDEGFAEQAEEPRYQWLPDYTVPGIESEHVSLVLAGLIGVGLVFGMALGAGAAIRRSKRHSGSSTA